ncbi:putative F-box protein [Platanthera guangdongensis]|uniref:F-box protein n=1 Tax=Platanthera guangdongensis TaxID=2320717 RepID=A0ABR2LRB2_9ASPA
MKMLKELYVQILPHPIALATRLRGLHLIDVSIPEKRLVETLKKFPMLDELEISRCTHVYQYNIVERVGKACPQLKSFIFDNAAYVPSLLECNDVAALAIAKHFKQLRRLRLFANRLTSIGLFAIIDNCLDLEYLDIRYCFNVNFLDGSLKNKCVRIKELRMPNDSIADYEYRFDEDVAKGSYLNLYSSDTEYYCM